MDFRTSKAETPNPGVKPPKKKMNKWLKGIIITACSFVGLFILLGCLSMCSTTKEVSISPSSTAIVGPVGDKFEVVDKPVTAFIKVTGFIMECSVKMRVNLKRIGKGNVSDYNFGVELIGENDEVLSVEFDSWHISENLETLDGLRVGEVSSVQFEFNTDSKLKAEKIKKFRIISKPKKGYESIEENTVLIDDELSNIEASVVTDEDDENSSVDEETSVEETEDLSDKDSEESENKVSKVSSKNENVEDLDNNSSEVSSTSGNNWDSLLDEYEKCVNELVPLVKKLKEGDTSVLDEYKSAKDNALKLKALLTKAKGNGSITKKQAARLALVSVKLGKAIF